MHERVKLSLSQHHLLDSWQTTGVIPCFTHRGRHNLTTIHPLMFTSCVNSSLTSLGKFKENAANFLKQICDVMANKIHQPLSLLNRWIHENNDLVNTWKVASYLTMKYLGFFRFMLASITNVI